MKTTTIIPLVGRHLSIEETIILTRENGVTFLDSTVQHGRKGSRLDAAMNALESLVLNMFEERIPFGVKMRNAIDIAFDKIADEYGD